MKIRQNRLLKKLISISLTLLTIATLTIPMCVSSSAAENTTDFLGGDGSKSNPYIISNKNHFDNIRKYADDNAYFSVICNIKFSAEDFESNGEFYNNRSYWLPIENFNGKINGNGYAVLWLETKKSVFGDNFGVIENLNIEQIESEITGVCLNNYGTITNCKVSGTIEGDLMTSSAGVTIMNYGAISGCNVIADVYSAKEISGIALENYGMITYCNKDRNTKVLDDYGEGGFQDASGISNVNNGVISYCSNTSDVTGGFYVAGISSENNGLISDCYNSGTISLASDIGGYDGSISRVNKGNIINCYNVGKETIGSNTYSYPLVNKNDKYISNCYCIVARYNSKYGTICTDEEMQKEETYKGFDFGGVWLIDASSDYKYPQLITTKAKVESIEIVDTENTYFSTKIGIYPDISSLSINVKYTDGTERIMKGSPFMLKKFDMNKLGEQTAPLYFGGKLTAETINVNVREKEISSISVTTKPKTSYVQGQSLDLSNGKLTVYYDNGTSEEIALSTAETYYVTQLTGIVPVTVEYEGFTTEFNITVKEREVKTMSLTQPDKLVYYKGEKLDLTNAKLGVVFVSSDNYSEVIDVTSDMVSGYNPNESGYQTLKVTYLGAKENFTVRVLDELIGDVNCDGNINVVDATEIQKYIVNKDALSQDGVSVADVNGDGAINVADATLIQKYVVGFVDSLG